MITIDEFKKWHDELLKEESLDEESLSFQVKLDRWFNRSLRTKKLVHEMLDGSSTKEYSVELNPVSEPNPALNPLNHPWENDELDSLIPEFFDDHTKEDIFRKMIDSGGHLIKTTRYVSRWMIKNRIAESKQKEVMTILSHLQGHITDLYNHSGTYKVVVTCDPRAFVVLGNTECDSSCFAHQGENPHHKWILSETKNTFVILGFKESSSTSFDYKNLRDNVIFRAWGVKKPTAAIISNKYTYHVSHGVADRCIQEAMKQIFGSEIVSGFTDLWMDTVYPNEDAVVFSKSNKLRSEYRLNDIWRKTISLQRAYRAYYDY